MSQITTVTFLFTDIEGSTARWAKDSVGMAAAVRRHDDISAAVVEHTGGTVFKTTGDGSCVAFSDPAAAVDAALTLRSRLAAEEWPKTIETIKVRTGIHTGPAEERDGDYFGLALSRVARLMAAGHAGQILVSEPTRLLLEPSIKTRDLGEHRLRDLLRPEHVYQLGQPGEEHPPLRSLDTRTNNLPIQVTPFIGREREVAELAELINNQPLVTLTGPGGTGKTRLALQVAAEVSDRFDRIYFVRLVGVSDEASVGPTIVDALGLEGENPGESVASVVALAEHRRLLLVLDNFEHVMAAAPWIGALLDQTTNATLLVTSRELLRLRAERNYPVSPLEVPQSLDMKPAELADFESVRLFAERARAATPDFALDDSTARDVAEICRRLDGLPLALELAAARVRLFTPGQLLTKLDSNLEMLRGGPVDAPTRQRTLLDTIRWSYDLLDEDEQVLFRRLAIFTGGRSLEAVEAVCLQGLGMDAVSAAEALADKSLVDIKHGTSGEPRLIMLSTIFGFARTELEADDDLEEVASRHARFFTDLAEEAEPELRGGDQTAWMARLGDERINMYAALEWSFGGGDPTLGMRIVAALRDYWFYEGRYPDMGLWVERALIFLSDAPPRLQAGVMLTAGFHAYGVYREDAAALLDQAVDLYAMVGDDAHRALALMWRSGAAALVEEEDSGRSQYEEGLELARRVGANHLIAQALNMRGEQLRQEGNNEHSRDVQLQALEIARQTGELVRVAMITHNLGFIFHHLGDDEQADKLLRESLDVGIEAGSSHMIAHSLVGIADQLSLRGDHSLGARMIGAAYAYFDSVGLKIQSSDIADHARIRAYLLANLGDAGYEREVAAGARLDLSEAIRLVQRT